MAEKGIRNPATDYLNKKRSTSTGTLPPPPLSKKHATSSSTGPYARRGTSASQGSISHPRCNKCGKPHTRECRMGTGVCFKCAKLATLLENVFKQVQVEDMGHRQASISPDRLLQQGCLHSLQKITVLVEYNAANIVTGTIPLFSSVACMLFDSGAMHSFISSMYVKLCKLNTKPLDQNIRVATPVGDAVVCRHVYEPSSGE